MKCLVTGAAGFIGSHLSQKLLKEGYSVIGLDSFTDFYSQKLKKINLSPLLNENNFEFLHGDINNIDTDSLVQRVDCIFHLAAQAGVRTSWGHRFSDYTRNNIEATQNLLEAARGSRIQNFIYASSSSVYGTCTDLPWKENSPLFPFSPYGVSKLAAEHLCSLYFKNYGVPTVSLRFFTVYGPGQRPDMAFHRFFKFIIQSKPVPIFGDGKQTRDFTFIDDIVAANITALEKGKSGEIYNVGGGSRRKLEDVIHIMEEITGIKIQTIVEGTKKGDVPDTYASIEKARKVLNYSPQVSFKDGLKEQWEWIQRIDA